MLLKTLREKILQIVLILIIMQVMQLLLQDTLTQTIIVFVKAVLE